MTVLATGFGCANNATLPEAPVFSEANYSSFLDKCSRKNGQRDDAACVHELESLLSQGKIWGATANNFRKGALAWQVPLQIDFQARKGDEGDFQIIDRHGELVPRISLSRDSDPFELLITINHELVHYAHSDELKAHISGDKKLNGCLLPFQKAILDNEMEAYLEEIKFWKEAPEWFRGASGAHFNSRLLGKRQVNYPEYYLKLESEIGSDASFIPKRYIALGKFPSCASRWY